MSDSQFEKLGEPLNVLLSRLNGSTFGQRWLS